jgi:cyanophycin synthetase
VTLPGDRRDDLLVQTAQAVAAWFGTVVLYEDSDRRGREPGEVQELIGSAMLAARPGLHCAHAENPVDALRTALTLANGGPVLFLYEKLTMAHDALTAVHAEPWPDAARVAADASATAEPVMDDTVLAEPVVDDTVVATSATPADASADYGSSMG